MDEFYDKISKGIKQIEKLNKKELIKIYNYDIIELPSMKLLKKVCGVKFAPYQSEIINIDEKFYKVKTREYIFDKMFSGKDNVELKIFVEKEDFNEEK